MLTGLPAVQVMCTNLSFSGNTTSMRWSYLIPNGTFLVYPEAIAMTQVLSLSFFCMADSLHAAQPAEKEGSFSNYMLERLGTASILYVLLREHNT